MSSKSLPSSLELWSLNIPCDSEVVASDCSTDEPAGNKEPSTSGLMDGIDFSIDKAAGDDGSASPRISSEMFFTNYSATNCRSLLCVHLLSLSDMTPLLLCAHIYKVIALSSQW